jgi:hypothetical protein
VPSLNGDHVWIRSPHELATGLPLPDHLLAVGIEGVVNDPFRSVDGVIVFVSEMTEAFCDRFKTGSFRLIVKCVVRVSAVDTMRPSNSRAASLARRYFLRNASNEHSFPW